MDESPELSVLVHELGGMLSSVQGFAHIAAENPDHPDRERFIKLTASEARRAAQTVKDIHLVRSFDHGKIDPAPPPVDLSELMATAFRQTSSKGLQLIGGLGVMVVADPPKVAGLLSRCIEAAVAPLSMTTAKGFAGVVLPIAPASDHSRKAQSLDAPYPDMIVYAILRRLVRFWGGDVTVSADGEWTAVTVAFRRV